jgi:FAD/FMN-containing dehydrogenase
MDWVERFTAAMEPARTGGVYLNFEPDTGERNVRSGFGDAKYERLAALKAEWDPDNLFSVNYNVAPRSAPA